MALALFRKQVPASPPAAASIDPGQATVARPVDDMAPVDPARDILDLLELELQAMMRQLERATQSVASGAQSTAQTLGAIRERTDALNGRTSIAQSTAQTFSQAAENFTRSAGGIGNQVRDASRLADDAANAAREASLNVDRLRESSAAIGNVVNLIASIAKQTTMLALNSTIEAARAGDAGRGFAVVATEVKALAVQTQNATTEIRSKIDALQQDAANSIDAVHRISLAIEAIRPVFDNVNSAVAEQSATTSQMAENAAATSNFIVSVMDSASDIDGVTKQAESHGEGVAEAGRAVAGFAAKLKSRCAVLLRQDGREDQRRGERLPCHLKIDMQWRGTLRAPVYEIATNGLTIGGPDAASLPRNETLVAMLDGIGACKVAITDQTNAGAVARFVSPDAALSEAIEDRMWAIRDENAEFVTRAMDAGVALNKIFADAVASGAVSMQDLFDTDYVAIDGSNPPQFRTRYLDWADRALLPLQEAFLANDKRVAFCAMIDRNGYLPVHNRIYSQPQRPHDVAWNTANSRNRRIFNDPAGLAAGRNTRSFLIQSYARDMGNGTTVMMREIDVPVRVQGKHWGGFRTAYKL